MADLRRKKYALFLVLLALLLFVYWPNCPQINSDDRSPIKRDGDSSNLGNEAIPFTVESVEDPWDLVILVLSSRNGAQRRNIIRQTWLQHLPRLVLLQKYIEFIE